MTGASVTDAIDRLIVKARNVTLACPWCCRVVGLADGVTLPRHFLQTRKGICPASGRVLSPLFVQQTYTKTKAINADV